MKIEKIFKSVPLPNLGGLAKVRELKKGTAKQSLFLIQ
jgi:hypothetical protein